jgi:3-phenylpropionate/trans-cinnamate dioxygenase ferredoxin component
MGNYIKAGVTADFPDGTKKKVVVAGKEILLTRVGSVYYAVQNKCPHMGGDLSAGKLEGKIVTCPRHGSQFDISTGKIVRWMKGSGMAYSIGKALKPARSLPVFKVKVEGDIISIEV